MRTVEISSDQVAEIARRIAIEFGHDPDTMVAYGPPASFDGPGLGMRYMLAPPSAFPVWRIFESAAKLAIASAGSLANVSFVVVQTVGGHGEVSE